MERNRHNCERYRNKGIIACKDTVPSCVWVKAAIGNTGRINESVYSNYITGSVIQEEI